MLKSFVIYNGSAHDHQLCSWMRKLSAGQTQNALRFNKWSISKRTAAWSINDQSQIIIKQRKDNYKTIFYQLENNFHINFAKILRIFSQFCEFGRPKCEAKAKRTTKSFLRSEANSLRFRNFSQSCEFAMRIWVSADYVPNVPNVPNTWL